LTRKVCDMARWHDVCASLLHGVCQCVNLPRRKLWTLPLSRVMDVRAAHVGHHRHGHCSLPLLDMTTGNTASQCMNCDAHVVTHELHFTVSGVVAGMLLRCSVASTPVCCECWCWVTMATDRTAIERQLHSQGAGTSLQRAC